MIMIPSPKKVNKVHPTTNIVVCTYKSMRECARNERIPPTSLYKAIKGQYSIKNFYYKYVNEN